MSRTELASISTEKTARSICSSVRVVVGRPINPDNPVADVVNETLHDDV